MTDEAQGIGMSDPLASTLEADAWPKKSVPVRVIACMSMPRLCFSDNMFAVAWLPSANVPIRKASGAFWEQSLTRLWEKAIDENYDYILNIDYDSVFQPIDFQYLLCLMATQEDAAAIFPMQYRRNADQLICSLPKYPNGEAPTQALQGNLIRAKVGHFGFTMLRTSVLKQLPRPWLWSQPNAEGRWEAGKIDADIYFWNKLYAHGHPVYAAPRLVIGHIQQMITWPDENLRPRHQYLSEYHENGDLPEDVKDAAMARTEAALREAAE